LDTIKQFPLCKGEHAVSFIKLLIAKSGYEESEIDADSLRLDDIDVYSVESDHLMTITSSDFDAVLIDDSPRQDSLALIRHFRSITPACKIIVRLRYSSAQAVSYLQSGVTGILDSLHDSDQLAEIIRHVCRGEYYLDKDISQLLAMRQIKKLLEPFTSLSSREFDVFCLLAEGCSLKTIAEQLGINSKTVSNCQTLIKLKLALNGKQAIKKLAKSHGLIMEKSV
jgi:two-component system invasion response regulator UvrY